MLTFFQGAEFFEPAAFAENPAALNPPQKVGAFEGGQWSEEGPVRGAVQRHATPRRAPAAVQGGGGGAL